MAMIKWQVSRKAHPMGCILYGEYREDKKIKAGKSIGTRSFGIAKDTKM